MGRPVAAGILLPISSMAGTEARPTIICQKPKKRKQKRLLQKCWYCHPERSEGSQPLINTRFFASLRMTILGKGEFCKRLS